MAHVVRPYRGVSADDRRAERRARLIEAGLDVLGADGLANTTMTAVCARAGLTERYFYESFRDRDDLLRAIFDSFAGPADEAVQAALKEAPPDLLERCRAAAGAMIGVLTDDPRMARAYVEACGSEALREQRAETVKAYAAVLSSQMSELYGLRGRRHRARLWLAALVLVGGVAEAASAWLEGALEISREELVDEIARLCVAAADVVRDAATGS